MRFKVVFFMALIVVVTLIVAVSFKHRESVPAMVALPVPVTNVATAPVPAPAPVPVKAPLSKDEREKQIEDETERLAVLAMNDDPQSLSNILGDLTSPEKEIRMAAIEATKQFDSTNAIPVLKAMAANASDAEEGAALLEAADFLSLPDANLVAPAAASPAATTNDMAPPQP